MIEVSNLGKAFRSGRKRRAARGEERDVREHDNRFHALEDVSFSTGSGAILGVLGPNGAGKTTMLRILATALRPTRGTARLDGIDIVEHPLEVRRRIGFLSGHTGLYGRLTAREMLRYYGRLNGMGRAHVERRIEQLIERLEMRTYADRRNDTLSTGMKQKVSLARTVMHDPEVLIIDEPTTGLDVAAAETVLEFIGECRAAGKSVLFSTHHMHEVERLCDAVILLARGRLRFAGDVEAMRARGDTGHLDEAFLRLIDREESDDVA